MCSGCSGFSDSIQVVEALKADHPDSTSELPAGFCVHTKCLSIVANELSDYERQHSNNTTTEFEHFIHSEVMSHDMCICVKRWNNVSRFIVIVPEDDAFTEDTTQHATCTFRQFGSDFVIDCDSVRCRRGKHKKLKNVVSQTDVCCHLRAALAARPEGSNVDDNIVMRNEEEDDDIDDKENCECNMYKFRFFFLVTHSLSH